MITEILIPQAAKKAAIFNYLDSGTPMALI